jgi:hypothetical protein
MVEHDRQVQWQGEEGTSWNEKKGTTTTAGCHDDERRTKGMREGKKNIRTHVREYHQKILSQHFLFVADFKMKAECKQDQ